MVAFGRPKLPIASGREDRWRYRLHWCRDHAWKPELATVAATRIGASNDGARLVVVDFAGGRLSKLADDAKPQVDAAASHGTLRNPVAYRHRSEERRDGKQCVSTCRFRWSPSL